MHVASPELVEAIAQPECDLICTSVGLTALTKVAPVIASGLSLRRRNGVEASPEPRWHLVGLVSWSYDKTCSHSLSTAFTKVLPFKDWIERNMK